MTEKYIPQVGDRVRRADWERSRGFTVTAVGRDKFLMDVSGGELPYSIDTSYPWIKVDPLPELWCNVYQYERLAGLGGVVHDKDRMAGPRHAFRVHLIPDGDGYRAEVIRP